MKIAIISFGHEGSSLPLGKALAQCGHNVDFYFDVHFGCKHSIEGTDIKISALNGLLGNVPNETFFSLSSWLDTDTFQLKYVNTFGEAKSKPILTPLFTLARKIQIRYICKELNALKYDVVYMVGRYIETDDIVTYSKYLKTKIVVGLHEVCNHYTPDFRNPSSVLRYLFNNNINIVVFSYNTYCDIKKYKDCNPANISLIHFGTFDTYRTCKVNNEFSLPKKYILYIGTINPYKGLPILVDAVEKIDTLDGWNFVIAGNGKDECLNKVKSNNRFLLINRFLENSEIAELLSSASVVVCPYVTMSQSGIPQTAFAFGVPIIASNLDGFKEVIVNGENGLFFEAGNTQSLCEQLEKIMKDQELLNILKEGASKFNSLHKHYSWNYIAQQYEKIFVECK